MPRSIQLQVFQRSFSTKGAGRGIGTYSIKLLTERYLGGKVSFVSEDGIGTRFSCHLPKQRCAVVSMNAAQAPAVEQPSRLSPVANDESTLPKLRILVAEDGRANQIIARKLLGMIGWEVEIVSNGQEALERVQAEPFDVVLMDIQMPKMDGLEATKAIRSLKSELRSLPIVALTGGTSAAEKRACLDAGMDDVLHKPFVQDDIRDTILKVAKR